MVLNTYLTDFTYIAFTSTFFFELWLLKNFALGFKNHVPSPRLKTPTRTVLKVAAVCM